MDLCPARREVARDHLFIDGAWRDHAIHALRDPHFMRPTDGPSANSVVR